MGEVFLAVDTRLDRNVALKYLSDPSLDTPHARERLLREARAAAKLTHPHIAAIYDIIESGDHPCIVMEFAQGETLGTLASRGPMPAAKVVGIGLQLADALSHAHAAGVIHRDLKPSNVVLTPAGAVKVLDFGVARVQSPEQDLGAADAPTREGTHTQAGRNAGTPMYMAPEQLAGHPASTLSDIYSLGATLFELLTGRRPFDGASTADVVYQVLSRPTPLVSAYNGTVSPLLTAIVAKAMAKDRVERYLSAEQMADDLKKAAAECATDPAGRSSKPTVTSSVADAVAAVSRRRGVMALAGAVLAGALLVGVAYAVWGRGPAPAAATGPQFVAVLPFANDTGDPGAEAEVTSLFEAMIATLEGLSGVTVLSRQDVTRHIMRAPDPRTSVPATGVTKVITGRVRGAALARQVTVVVQQPQGAGITSHTFSPKAGQMTPFLGAAVRAVVDDLSLTLTAKDQERLNGAPACRADTYVQVARGRTFLDRKDTAGNAERALEAFRTAVLVDGGCALAQAGLADAAWATYGDSRDPARFAEATAAIIRAHALDPASPAIQISLARHYQNQGKPAQAEPVIKDVIARRLNDDEPHRVYSTILDDLGRSEEAAAEIGEAIRLRPGNMINELAQGFREHVAGNYARAIASYERVLGVQPDNEMATVNVIAAYVATGDFAKALKLYESSPVRDRDPAIRGNVGSAYLALHRCDEAARLLKSAVDENPQSDIKRRNLGDAYACLGRRAEARQQYEQAVALAAEALTVNKSDAAVMARRAVYEAKLGRTALASRHIDDAVALKGDDHDVLFKCAVVHALGGERAEAVRWLQKALDAGHSRQLASTDTDLDSIRQMPEVRRMLGGDH